MIDFESLDSETCCAALVGSFLQTYALMESAMHDAITEAVGLQPLQGLIVCKNLQFRDKIHILRAAVSRSWFTPEQKLRFDKLLIEIGGYSHKRNTCAHEPFGPWDKGRGVEFFVIQAKGRLKFPDTVWSLARFQEEFATLERFTHELEALAKEYAVPKPSTASPAMENYLARLLQFAQHSDPASPVEAGEMPPTLPEKS